MPELVQCGESVVEQYEWIFVGIGIVTFFALIVLCGIAITRLIQWANSEDGRMK